MSKRKSSSKIMSNEPINFYEEKKVQRHMTKSHNPNYNNHLIKLPFRSIIVGSSGAGKSNMVCNILARMGETFNRVIIVTKAKEPLYDYLQSQIPDDMLEIHYELDILERFKEPDFFWGQTLVIFDDLCNETLKTQAPIAELYIRGRKLGVSMIYITQSYYKVPKVIRLQTQYIFIIKVSGMRDLNMILSEYSLTATKHQLQSMYNYVCNSGVFGNAFVIDLDASQDKTYRKNFLEFLNPADF